MDDEQLLEDQRAYYRARAPEYDEWWQRRDRYDRGEAMRAEWDRQVAEVEAALEAFGADGDVLELAGGTGWWTQRLAATADRLTTEDPYVAEYREDLHIRHLNDGSEHRVVKVMYEPDELTELLAAEGWDAELTATRWFVFGSATPR